MKELNQIEVEQVSGGCFLLAAIIGRLVADQPLMPADGEASAGAGKTIGSIIDGIFGSIFGTGSKGEAAKAE